MIKQRQNLGELLIAYNLVSIEQLEECLALSEDSNSKPEEILIEKGFVAKDTLYRVMEQYYGVPYIDLDAIEENVEATSMLSAELARQNHLVPVKKKRIFSM